jgi:hypothetical protein
LSKLVEIHWHNFSRTPNEFLEASFAEFTWQMGLCFPDIHRIEFTRLLLDHHPNLSDYLVAHLPGRVICQEFGELDSMRLFIFCDWTESFAEMYREENELAHWGVAIPGRLAIAWEPNKYLLWHEALHLLNAKDCYNKFGINKCPVDTCIMRRAPSKSSCGPDLVLCTNNRRRIHRYIAELEAISHSETNP